MLIEKSTFFKNVTISDILVAYLNIAGTSIVFFFVSLSGIAVAYGQKVVCKKEDIRTRSRDFCCSSFVEKYHLSFY
jgi:hypothetical protein